MATPWPALGPRRLLAGLGMVAAAAAASASTAAAQQLIGAVVEADGATPARYIALLVKDSTGRVVARATTSAAGEFRLALPLTSGLAVHALRVGYAPIVTPLPRLGAGAERRIRIVLDSRPVSLPVVLVRGSNRCTIDGAMGAGMVSVWDQARAALVGVAAANPDPTLSFEAVTYRTFEEWPSRTAQSVVDAPRRFRGDAFRSRPASDLVRGGFVRATADSVEYLAPDAQVLVDATFASRYCFWLEPGPVSNPDWVGLGMRPAERAGDRVDISGVLWLRRDGSLVRFDFEYVGLAAGLEAAQAGGTVEFLQLPTRQWIVWRWKLRFPQTLVGRHIQGVGVYAQTFTRSTIGGIVVRGGLVTSATWSRGETLVIGGRALELAIKNRAGSSQELVGTTVDSAGAAESSIAGAPPVVRLDAVTPGVRTFRVQTPLMRDAGVPAQAIAVTILPDTGVLRGELTVPSVDEVIRLLCGPGQRARGSAVVVGTLGRDRGPSGAEVLFVSRAGAFDRRGGTTLAGERVTVDSSGRWLACDIPRAETFVLWSERGGERRALGRFRVPASVELAIVGAAGPGAGERFLSEPTGGAARGPGLSVRVIDAVDSSAIIGAHVVVDEAIVLVPRGDSAYQASGMAAGVHLLSVRRLGYVPIEDSVTINATGTSAALVLMDRLPALLAEVMVAGRRVQTSARYEDVIRRAASGDGVLFTRDDLAGAMDIKSVISRVPGVHVTDQGIQFPRCQGGLPDPVSSNAREAKVQVYIDGVLIHVETESPRFSTVEQALRLVHARDIEFIEVYRGVARIPVEFLSDACAVIAIWTRAY